MLRSVTSQSKLCKQSASASDKEICIATAQAVLAAHVSYHKADCSPVIESSYEPYTAYTLLTESF